jgi:glutamine amidotransferase
MIGILDYGMGNISSVVNAISFLGTRYCIVQEVGDLSKVSHLIIPGVGSYDKAMHNIQTRDLKPAIQQFARNGYPLLGICLGMQLLSDIGYEQEETSGLEIIRGEVVPIDFEGVRVPHIGWNGIRRVNDHPILYNVKVSADFYFVHSYHFKSKHQQNTVAITEYGNSICSIVVNDRGNAVGIQFHPEKSQKQGIKIIENFISMEKC